MKETKLPSVCKEHPNAQIRHEWIRDVINYNGGLRQHTSDKCHKYSCAECGKELCSPEEYEKRQKQ